MQSKITYRDQITGALRAEYAQVLAVTDRYVILRSANGLRYNRDIELVETIAGKPVDDAAPTTPTATRTTTAEQMARTVHADRFVASHWCDPLGFGLWLFQDAQGEVHERTATYTDAVRSLPAGEFVLLP